MDDTELFCSIGIHIEGQQNVQGEILETSQARLRDIRHRQKYRSPRLNNITPQPLLSTTGGSASSRVQTIHHICASDLVCLWHKVVLRGDQELVVSDSDLKTILVNSNHECGEP